MYSSVLTGSTGSVASRTTDGGGVSAFAGTVNVSASATDLAVGTFAAGATGADAAGADGTGADTAAGPLICGTGACGISVGSLSRPRFGVRYSRIWRCGRDRLPQLVSNGRRCR